MFPVPDLFDAGQESITCEQVRHPQVISVECNQGRRTVRETDLESIDQIKGIKFRSNLCFGPAIIIRYKNVGVAWLGLWFKLKGICKCDGEQLEEE